MHLKKIFLKSITHSTLELKQYKSPIEQLDFRFKYIEEFINNAKINKIDCIVSRGGLIRPIPTGSYKINQKMLDDLTHNRFGSHVSNISPILAKRLANKFHCIAIIVDPEAVDEFIPLAYYSGIKAIKRRSQLHALNIRAIALEACDDLNLIFTQANFITVHLGGGITVAAIKQGKIIDANNALEEGSFSPNRGGHLPTTQLVDLCFSGQYKNAKELNNLLTTQSGLVGYLGTDDGQEILSRIKKGDTKAKEVLEAMAYQISKEIGAMATVLSGKVNAILITGGFARPPLLDWIKHSVDWIAPIYSYPGSHEQEALAKAGARFLTGNEKLKEY
jgi:butyrate kinase